MPLPAKDLSVSFTLNGKVVRPDISGRSTLLDVLRENLNLPGTKKGCDHGQCGACTVLVDGRRVLSCLTLAASLKGKSVTTIEGLAHGEELHPVQAAFVAHDAFQCGFCTPGQIMSAVGFLGEPWPATSAAVREGMSGNLCRCGAYCGIVAAVTEARKNLKSAHA
jgi:xanthine dehydrogenase YagT iron-sulfur-binding subunit